MNARPHTWVLASSALCLMLPAPASQASGGGGAATAKVSASSSGSAANLYSSLSSISANGRWVAFESAADNLVPGDTNLWDDIFIRDRWLSTTVRVSVTSSGAQANQGGQNPTLSGDGRFVAFASSASNLVAGDTNGQVDIFVHDRKTGLTQRASVSSAGVQGNGQSSHPLISADGRFVSFTSVANTLVLGDGNGIPQFFSGTDVFVRDLVTGITERVSVNSAGEEGHIPGSYLGSSSTSGISADGRFVAFSSANVNFVPNDINGFGDVFVHDRLMHTTELVSVSDTGQQGDYNSANGGWNERVISISADGRYVAFESGANNLAPGDLYHTDILVRDRVAGTTELVSKSSLGVAGNQDSTYPAISSDGRYVAFNSLASNLVPGDTNNGFDVFLHDRWTGSTERISVSSSGVEANQSARGPAISADARWIAFYSDATNLVAGDNNNVPDVFVRQRELTTPSVYCIAKENSLGCTPSIAFSGTPSVSVGTGFVISVSNVSSGLAGVLMYSTNGAHASPFDAGWLCIRPPLRFTPLQFAQPATWPPDCSGALQFDFNPWIAAGADPALIAGRQVWAQYRTRDPGFARPDNIGLSDALTFVIGP